MNTKKWISGLVALSAAVVLTVENAPFPFLMPAAAESDPVVVVSLGDSYSAGEGIEPFYGQDLDWAEKQSNEDWLAHRSELSWPGRLQFSDVTGNLVNYNVKHPAENADLSECKWYFAASSGAKTKHMTQSQSKTVYRNEAYDGEKTKISDAIAPQFDIFNEIEEEVDYVTITIGGNDVGFATIITSCVMWNSYLHIGTSDLEEKLQEIEDNISTHLDNIVSVYEGIQSHAPNAEILVAGYPKLVHKNGTKGPFNRNEIDLVNEKVSWFNDQIADRVALCQQSGMKIHFISVENAFDGHGAYAPEGSDAWINKVQLSSNDEDLDCKTLTDASAYSMHPNSSGAQAYADRVNAKIRQIEELETTGIISGKVIYANGLPAFRATVNIYRLNGFPQKIQTLRTTILGKFGENLPAGDYRLEILAPGCVKFTLYTKVVNGSTTILPTCKLVTGATYQSSTISGQVIDGVTGRGIPNALVYTRRGWDNPGDGPTLTQTRTDANGNYTMRLPIGNYTVYANIANYIPNHSNVICQNGRDTVQHITMSPATDINDIRVVLEWGVDPYDLDSHLVGRYNETSTNKYHVYYRNKSVYNDGVEICNLDVDDVTSYGPETITLNPTTDDAYYYYVHHYAGSGSIATSSATVKVYQGQTLLETYNVPSMQGNGIYWNVFAYKNGEIIVENTITSAPDTTYAG